MKRSFVLISAGTGCLWGRREGRRYVEIEEGAIADSHVQHVVGVTEFVGSLTRPEQCSVLETTIVGAYGENALRAAETHREKVVRPRHFRVDAAVDGIDAGRIACLLSETQHTHCRVGEVVEGGVAALERRCDSYNTFTK